MKTAKRFGTLFLILVILFTSTVIVFAASANTYPVNLTKSQAEKIINDHFKDHKGTLIIGYKGLLMNKSTKKIYHVFSSHESFSSGNHIVCWWLIDTKTKKLTGNMAWAHEERDYIAVYNIAEDGAKYVSVDGVKQKTYDGEAQKLSLTVRYNRKTLTEGKDYVLKYKNNNAIGTATVEIWGAGNYVGKVTKTFRIVDRKNLPSNAKRVYGNTRYETATNIAKQIKSRNGNKAFSAIVVATGNNYPDALTGAYLAYLKDAPILLTTSAKENSVVKYIKNNLASNGTVYILGGEYAVPASFARKLKDVNIRYKRLGGRDRYGTNLKILSESKNLGDELIVVTGKNFPDALSSSALAKPILLVNEGLTTAQKEFLRKNKFSKITIIGGDKAVLPAVKTALSSYAKTGRIAGSDRYETSAKVASTYFKSTSTMIVLAIGSNYPDALTGSPFAMKLKAPMILTNSAANEYKHAKNYRKSSGATNCIVLGGNALVTNHAVNEIMNTK